MKKVNKNLFKFGLGTFFLISLLFLNACSVNRSESFTDSKSREKLKVAATIFPLYDLVKEIGGDKVDIVLLLPPGASPHTFEMTPEQLKNFTGSELLFAIGANLDTWAVDLVSATNNGRIIDLSESVELRAFSNFESDVDYHEENEDDDHGHEGLDPHYFLSPKQAVKMADRIAAELGKLDENNSEYYSEQAKLFSEKISINFPIWQERLSDLNNRNLIIFHNAWSYFAYDFDLQVVATFEPFPGKSPSPKYLEAISEAANFYKVNKLFIEPQLAVSVAETLAQDLNLEVRTLDPLGGLDNRDSYFSLIDYNVNEIAR